MSSCLLQGLKGVGVQKAQLFAALGIRSVADLLFHFPLRYEDRTRLTSIAAIQEKQLVVVLGHIQSTEIVYRPKPQLICYFTDSSGLLRLRFIHYNKFQHEQLNAGVKLLIVGEARYTAKGFEVIHPEYRILEANEVPVLPDSLTPVYPSIEGISQRLWLSVTEQALRLNVEPALQYLHRPPKNADLALLQAGKHEMQQQLILEELVAHRLALLKRRKKQQNYSAEKLPLATDQVEKFILSLPFTLTLAQKKVLREIEIDLVKPHPMMRLLQGDVGSGKTIVAVVAMLHAVSNQKQVAMMVPTALLAEQHYQVIRTWLEPLGVEVLLLTGSSRAVVRREILEKLANGTPCIVMGTHALFQQDVHFRSLSLVVIDEQHRFGVNQRFSLNQKGKYPHQLMMTATPIPRTLAMNSYADLDCSIIDELPKGRKPIKTIALANTKRLDVVERMITICAQGQQVYWVCPLIEESELLQCQAAETSYALLTEQLPMLRVGLVHGRMNANEKERVMRDFKEKHVHVLVATTVIEVGVDVPNASLMVIENTERLGLAQLHQLRGRVGRGSLESFCLLMYQTPLSLAAKERIAILRETNDGFKIAEKDLEIRGPGEVLGTRQTGDASFRIANIIRDQYLLPQVQMIADQVFRESPARCEQLIARWLGNKERFASV